MHAVLIAELNSDLFGAKNSHISSFLKIISNIRVRKMRKDVNYASKCNISVSVWK